MAQIIRKMDTANATYDITGLTRKEFSNLLSSYEKQMYIWHNREVDINDSLLNKLLKMQDSDTFII